MTASTFHVIKDPVHDTIQFTSEEDGWIKPFIDSPQFQRLRHIKQMGLGDLIFPGAVHTRFNHCIGCCYVGSQIARKIGLSDSDRQLVMIACLLHDVGHGPFSHAFEGVFQKSIIRHELWTPHFLMEYENEEFFNRYNKLNPHAHLNKEKFRVIADMIMHRPIHKHVLADIVSSQLDADRLDYLLRDNHFCGVRYGDFDIRWMLHCMTIVKSPEGDRLGITHKGIGVVEHYLMARRLMTRNIYQLQKKLAIEHLMILLFASLAESMERHAPFADISATRLGKFLLAANEYNRSTESSKQDIEALKHKFLETNFPNYKDLCDYDVFALIKQLSDMDDDHPAVEIAKRLQFRIMPKIIRLDHADLESVNEELKTFKASHHTVYQDWQLTLLKTPHRSYSGEDDPILVVNEKGEIKTIDQYSIMIDALSDRLENVAFLFIDKSIAEDKPVAAFIRHLRATEQAV
ncbi:MAG TPA: HD domain-containing protein [Gammaproteobacteria bacterium]|jgi:HD superfamily phosphohydrolase|nr:HD domain-containing protein [Gammaproteobacteria bacterium]